MQEESQSVMQAVSVLRGIDHTPFAKTILNEIRPFSLYPYTRTGRDQDPDLTGDLQALLMT